MTDLATAGNVLVPEGESDDEYEQIPKKTEKPRKLESSETSRGPVITQRPPTETSEQDALPAAEGVVADDVKPQEAEKLPQPDAGATDDDWLRSRTNRLLDLLDPDDLPRPAEPAVEAETVVRDDREDDAAPPSPRDAAEEDAPKEAEDKGADAPGADDAVATISRTSRLFVRNLPYTTTEEDLHEEFGKFGTLQEVSYYFPLSPFPPPMFAKAQTQENMMNPKIGTSYATACDVNLGDYFSRCFDSLISCSTIHQDNVATYSRGCSG